jgi:oligopeptide/dipeptide ABC transporter ATP-binding protein
MNAILDVRDLCIDYYSEAGRRLPALRGVSFSLRPGEVLGIIGESGSGKSTLATSLLNLLPGSGHVAQGSVALEGQNIFDLNRVDLAKVRGKKISLISQEPSAALHPTRRIGNQVGEVLRAHESLNRRTKETRVRDVLASVFASDLDRIYASYPHELSGGQKQRVVVAQAIACNPSVVVADELTASLDPTTQREIVALFQELRRRFGLALVMITHNPLLLAGFADSILVLYAGKIVEMGPAEEVLINPRHPYTRGLMDCMPTLDGRGETQASRRLPAIRGEAPNLVDELPGCQFEPRCPERVATCVKAAPVLEEIGVAHTVSCFRTD